MAGQVIYHLLAAAHATRAPWPVVVLVSCLPVVTLGFGAALTHLLRAAHPAGHRGDHRGQTQRRTHLGRTRTDPATTADITADTSPGRERGHRARPGKRSPRRTGTGGTAAAVARLRDRHPDMTAADIARRLGVSDRTVRRHLAAPPDVARQAAIAA